MSTFGTTLQLSALDGTDGFQISGEVASEWAGRSVSSAGDVNGDGFDDVIVGASGASPNGTYSGAAWVVFGTAGGFAANLNLSTEDSTTSSGSWSTLMRDATAIIAQRMKWQSFQIGLTDRVLGGYRL